MSLGEGCTMFIDHDPPEVSAVTSNAASTRPLTVLKAALGLSAKRREASSDAAPRELLARARAARMVSQEPPTTRPAMMRKTPSNIRGGPATSEVQAGS